MVDFEVRLANTAQECVRNRPNGTLILGSLPVSLLNPQLEITNWEGRLDADGPLAQREVRSI